MPRFLPFHPHAALATLAIALAACASPANDHGHPPPAVIAVAGAPMAFLHQGERVAGTPAVVFQSGLGDDHAVWRDVLQQLPAGIEAIAPDRPGYGASPAREEPRDACRIAEEQRALLLRSGVVPPYLLVGHSLGGLYQYVYARLYPKDVAGLVLLDPTHPDILATLQREQPGAAALLQLARQLSFTPAMRQEFDAQTACLERLPGAPALAVPTQLLASTELPVYLGSGMRQLLEGLRGDWSLRTGAAPTHVAGSGHHIHRDAPVVVARAIEQLLCCSAD